MFIVELQFLNWVMFLSLFFYSTPLLPGGGTSLYIGTDTAVAYLSNFTALAGATDYAVEFWVLNTSPYYQPATVMFSTPDADEYLVIYCGEYPSITLVNLTDFPPVTYDKSWHHVAMTACQESGLPCTRTVRHLRSRLSHRA